MTDKSLEATLLLQTNYMLDKKFITTILIVVDKIYQETKGEIVMKN